MRDYKVDRDVRYFGTDNPATAVAERVPFVVQTEGHIKFVTSASWRARTDRTWRASPPATRSSAAR